MGQLREALEKALQDKVVDCDSRTLHPFLDIYIAVSKLKENIAVPKDSIAKKSDVESQRANPDVSTPKPETFASKALQPQTANAMQETHVSTDHVLKESEGPVIEPSTSRAKLPVKSRAKPKAPAPFDLLCSDVPSLPATFVVTRTLQGFR